MDIFAELITKNKKYHLLKKNYNLENIRIIIINEILTKKEAITSNIYTSKLLFFLTLFSQDLVDEDLDKYSIEKKLKKK